MFAVPDGEKENESLKIPEEARLFREIANDSADGIYVIGKENYNLLYVNEPRNMSRVGNIRKEKMLCCTARQRRAVFILHFEGSPA